MKKQFVTSLLIIISLISFGQINLDSGLVAKYYFNGNLNDESGHGYNGSFVNGPALLYYDRCGNPNSAYFFDGNEYINITTSPDGFAEFDSLQSTYSIALWLNTHDNQGTLFSNMTKDGVHFLGFTVGGMIDFGIGSCSGAAFINTIHPVWDGKWHYIVAILSTHAQMIYLDGHLAASASGSSYIGTYNCGIQIGTTCCWAWDNGNYFGLLDDIRIYNRVLDTTEIDSLYHECNTIGIEENFFNHVISISPNPFATSAQITFNQTYQTIALEVYDIQGKLLMQNRYAACDHIELRRGNLEDGLYFLKITLDGNKVETRKIVVSY